MLDAREDWFAHCAEIGCGPGLTLLDGWIDEGRWEVGGVFECGYGCGYHLVFCSENGVEGGALGLLG